MIALQKILIATDGSEASKIAFHQSLEFIKNDTILIVAHISNPQKNYLPPELEEKYIYEEYHTELISRIHEDKFLMDFDQKIDETQEIQNLLLLKCQNQKANLIVIGYHGRKGLKNDITIMGTTVFNTVYKCPIPMLIVKEQFQREENKGFNYLVCLDGSQKSINALEACTQMIQDKNDKIYAIHIQQGRGIIPQIQGILDNFEQFNVQLVVINKTQQTSQIIIEYVNYNEEINFNFVFVGINGIRSEIENQKYIGGCCIALIQKVKANVVLIP